MGSRKLPTPAPEGAKPAPSPEPPPKRFQADLREIVGILRDLKSQVGELADDSARMRAAIEKGDLGAMERLVSKK